MSIKFFVRELSNGTDYQSLLKPPETHGLHSGRVYLKPQADCGRHNTGAQEETLIFLFGKGQAVIEDKTFPVGEGKVVYIPPNTEHNIVNNSEKPLCYIYCVVPVNGNGG